MTYQCGPVLKNDQKQILYGTILGGSSIIHPERGKNCYLAMRDHDNIWLTYKIEMLKEFFKLDQNTIKKDKNTYRCYSVAYPVFNDIYDSRTMISSPNLFGPSIQIAANTKNT